MEVRTFSSLILLLLSVKYSKPSNLPRAKISITPEKVAIDGKVRFECVLTKETMEKAEIRDILAVSIRLYSYMFGEVADQVMTCDNSTIVSMNSTLGTGRFVPPVNCTTMILDDVTASGRKMEAPYVCSYEITTASEMLHRLSSETARLELTGEPTPPVTRFGIANAATGAPIERGSQVSAGLRLNVFCDSVPLKRPPPAITVSVTGGGVHSSHSPCSRLDFFVTVPREPRVAFNCSAFNGFGTLQRDEFSITSVYGPILSEVETLQEADTNNDEEQLLCSVRNNPPKRLTVTGLEPDLLKFGYPKFVEKPGLSLAYVKFNKMAARTGGRLVTFWCGVEGSEYPVVGAFRLTGRVCNRLYSFDC